MRGEVSMYVRLRRFPVSLTIALSLTLIDSAHDRYGGVKRRALTTITTTNAANWFSRELAELFLEQLAFGLALAVALVRMEDEVLALRVAHVPVGQVLWAVVLLHPRVQHYLPVIDRRAVAREVVITIEVTKVARRQPCANRSRIQQCQSCRGRRSGMASSASGQGPDGDVRMYSEPRQSYAMVISAQ